MINFVCTCGEPFSVPEELIGSSVQCPTCRRLVDVPTPTELDGFADDGTIKIDESRITPNPELHIELIPRRGEDDDVDRRNAYDAGDESFDEIPFKDEPGKPAAPKYDPVTGELIRPLEVKKDEFDVPAEDIPVALAAPVSYATGDLQKNVSPWKAAIELFMPGNVLVMVILLVAHVFHQLLIMFSTAAVAVLLLLFPAIGLLGMVILSHYSNIVEEIGFHERNELPTPLRNVSLIEDVWTPFTNLFATVMICFGPAFYLYVNVPPSPIAPLPSFGLALLGFFFFPAVWLTLVTSGSIVNLRPDRVWGVVRAGGTGYVAMAALGFLATAVYVNGLLMVSFNTVFYGFGFKQFDVPGALEWPALFTGIYLMHWFAWCVGLLYRAHYHSFPWVLQRHIPDPKKRRGPVQRKKRPYAGPAKIPPAVPVASQAPRATDGIPVAIPVATPAPTPARPRRSEPQAVQAIPVDPLEDLPMVHPAPQPNPTRGRQR